MKPAAPANETMPHRSHANVYVDADNCVAVDLPCINCLYNLKLTPAYENCPECGTPVAASLEQPHWLLYLADRKWVWKLRLGAFCLFIAELLPFLGFFLQTAGLLPPSASVRSGLTFLVFGGGLLLEAVGMLLLTRPEPDRRQSKTIRVLAYAALWVWLSALAISTFQATGLSRGELYHTLTLIFFVLRVAGCLLAAGYLQHLLFRTGMRPWRLLGLMLIAVISSVAFGLRLSGAGGSNLLILNVSVAMILLWLSGLFSHRLTAAPYNRRG